MSGLIISAAEREKVIALVEQAGGAILKYFKPRAEGPESDTNLDELALRTKGDGSPVTKADFASNNILVTGLQELFPADGILSEEGVPGDPQLNAARLWVIDPLDGTQSFIDGLDDFSVLLALCLNGEPQFSVMNFPPRAQLLIAGAGQGALLKTKQQELKLQVSASRTVREKSLYVRHCQLKPEALVYDKWMDSGCALLNLCQGNFDGIIIRLLRHREWDLAAPALAITESGGKVSDEHGRAVKFTAGSLKSKYVVASNGLVHEELLELIAQIERANTEGE